MTDEAIKDLLELQKEAASGELDLSLDGKNPHFNSEYTTLKQVLQVARPLLNKHNFVLMQRVDIAGDWKSILITELLHASGTAFRSNYVLTPQKQDPQGIGAAITYARRFSIKSMLAMADVDDDGNEASGLPAKPEKKPGAPRIDPNKVARQQDFMKWAKDNEDILDAYLRAPTYGKEGSRQPWVDENGTWNSLLPAQLDVILKSDKNLAAFKNAVLAFNQITP